MKCAARQSGIIQEDPVAQHYRKGEPLKKALSPLCRHLGKRKRPLFLVAFRNSLILMVPEAGIEPARRERRGILKTYSTHLKTISYAKTATYKRDTMRPDAVLCELCGSKVDIIAVC
ncbi:hypothetical protein ACET73_19350 [Aeromonas veronii]